MHALGVKLQTDRQLILIGSWSSPQGRHHSVACELPSTAHKRLQAIAEHTGLQRPAAGR